MTMLRIMHTVSAGIAFGCYAKDVSATINGVMFPPLKNITDMHLSHIITDIYEMSSILQDYVVLENDQATIMLLCILRMLNFKAEGATENYMCAFVETYKALFDETKEPGWVSPHFHRIDSQAYFEGIFPAIETCMNVLHPKMMAQDKSHV